MSLPFVLACLWCIAANFAGMLPSRHSHWPAAYTLIAIGLPILVWLWIEDGPWLALVFLIAGMSILRWPVRYLWRWVNRVVGNRE